LARNDGRNSQRQPRRSNHTAAIPKSRMLPAAKRDLCEPREGNGFLRPDNRRRSHRANLSQCTILVTLVSSLLFLAACSGISVPASSSSSNPTGVVVTVSPATVRSSRADLPKGHRSLARQDLLNRPLNPFDFFADYSDRLLVFRWVGQRSDCFQSASYLMTPSPNEVEPSTPLLAISVNASDEPSGEPGKHQTKQHLNRNTIGYAVKL